MYRFFIIYFFSLLTAQHSFASYPSYHSFFYKGLIVIRGAKDTIHGQILLEPNLYYDYLSFKNPFENYIGYAVVSQLDSITNTIHLLFFKTDQIVFARLFYKVVYMYQPVTNVYSLNYSFPHRPNQLPKTNTAKLGNNDNIKEFYTDFKSFIYNNDTMLLRMLNSGKACVFDKFLNPEKNITDNYALFYFLTPAYSSFFSHQNIFIFSNGALEKIPGHAE